MPNHLISENSPYLLQHANNPVDWYPSPVGIGIEAALDSLEQVLEPG